jgi:aminoglycoside/choline kinase family phosphotransferase
LKKEIKSELIQLFEHHFQETVDRFTPMPASGSYREYYRIRSKNHSVVGVYNTDVKENTAFLSFTSHFLITGIPVPEIYTVSSDLKKYLLEDLGDTTLFSFLTKTRETEGFSETITAEYRKVLSLLPEIQLAAGKGIDYSVCYPREAFDKQSMMWDLNYFKYYFLKLARIPFDEQALEDDFQALSDFLLSAPSGYFLYRDFQSRNVMLKEGKVFFIDYQGGRRGALQYDLASLLYDGKADIPPEVRSQLFDFYLAGLQKYMPVDEIAFTTYYQGFVLIRIMQAMGAYGFRGLYEKKEIFLRSIPYAIKNLQGLLPGLTLPVKIPELLHVLELITRSEALKEMGQEKSNLTVRITSFSYKKGIPADQSGNGGGFVFDCRALNNPGRHAEMKNLTGKDLPVQQFIEQNTEMQWFLNPVKSLVEQAVKNYMERGFTHLFVAFGCTGGQHRSVYAAEKTAGYIRNSFPVNVVLVHRELETLGEG